MIYKELCFNYKKLQDNFSKIVISNTTLEQVSRFKYLGCAVRYEFEYNIKEKINKFRNICGTIHRNLKNKIRQSTRIKFYKPIAIPILTYASEAWVITKKEWSKIQSADMQLLQNTLNYTLQDRIRIAEHINYHHHHINYDDVKVEVHIESVGYTGKKAIKKKD